MQRNKSSYGCSLWERVYFRVCIHLYPGIWEVESRGWPGQLGLHREILSPRNKERIATFT